MADIQQMVKLKRHDELDMLNQYHVNNAWFDVDFGGCPYGIFSAACPIEPLHAIKNGMVPACLSILFKEVIKKPPLLAKLDTLARKFTKLPRQKYLSSGSDKDMPRLLWKDGITSLTDITEYAKVSIMFTVVVIRLTKDGNVYFSSVLGNEKI